MNRWNLTSWGVCLLLLACNDPDPVTNPTSTTESETCPTNVPLEDPGEVCLVEDGLWAQLVIAGGCASILGGGCSAALDGDRIVVEGWAEVDPGCPDPDQFCVLDKGALMADCGLPTLTDGTWTLVYGAEEVTLEWPLTDTVCAGEAPPAF